MSELDGAGPASTAKTPAISRESHCPPRVNVPGRLWTSPGPPLPLLPPKQLESPSLNRTVLAQSVQAFSRSAQSATHSFTLPTMSNTPQLDSKFFRPPAFPGPPQLQYA